MWKFVSRGIRESLERRANCWTNIYPHTSQDGSGGSKSEVNQTSKVHKQVSIDYSISRYFNICRGFGAAGPDGDKSRGYRWNPKYSWVEAVEWSGLLALGLVVCQSLCIHRRFFGPDPEAVWRRRISQAHQVGISKLLNGLMSFEPHHILPITNCVGNGDRSEDRQESSEDSSCTSQKPYGPITIEEALQDAGDDFTRIHRIVMGEFEFQMGMKALEEKRHKEAVKHFSAGASLASSASMFNLAVCHEMGLGTSVNHKEAAKRYRAAAENGHADAMYNLGVFHAQGRGGLEVNMKMARKLFTEAAKLGQPQAQHALNLEKSTQQKVHEPEFANDSTRCLPIEKTQMHTNKSSYLPVQLVGL
ncbi:uncharacterized protein [Neodiprion pinetum]|uniref:Uncharacterized protein LOC107216970 isoform X1 n=1 Tax=Neodiprion lecontei TaxID=441921 RepID=A0A6J0B6N8_NEOLC|nr:uncharacterized protein LOC107216970 isoform X1 [Neodiprion lecontei]XP_046474771.1 uncharacterized protein LOC124215436 isoform X1 [Neodiprion pinetum]